MLTDAGDARLGKPSVDEKGRRVSGEHVQALRRILTMLGQEQNLSMTVDRLLIAITEELGGHSVALWIPGPTPGKYMLYKTSCDGRVLDGAKQLGHPYAARRGRFKKKLIANALARGIFAIGDVRKSRFVEPEVAQWMMNRGIKSLLCVPLTIGKDSVGVLTIRSTSLNAFNQNQKQLAQLLAHPTGLAVHLLQLAKQAEQTAILEERTRIAVEIHDSLSQILFEIITRLELARKTVVPETDSGSRAELEHVQLLAREALTEAQRTMRALGPAQVERQGLFEALKDLAAKRSSDVRVEFSLKGKPRTLRQKTENELFRISQEAVNNALRHAKATKVHLELVYEADRVKLTVEDDGQGFDLERAEVEGGFGLTSLRQRIERAGGHLAIRSRIGLGTRIVAEIPGERPSTRRSPA